MAIVSPFGEGFSPANHLSNQGCLRKNRSGPSEAKEDIAYSSGDVIKPGPLSVTGAPDESTWLTHWLAVWCPVLN